MNRKPDIYHIVNAIGIHLLIALWSYAFIVKVADLAHYHNQMNEQPFSPGFILSLTYLLPLLEGLVALLLILNKQMAGLSLSLLLLLAFTVYVLLVLGHYFPHTPCSCGGFISKMSWKNHLWFNLGLIALNGFCFYYKYHQERRSTASINQLIT